MIYDLQSLPETVGDYLATNQHIGGLILSAVTILLFTLILLIVIGKFKIKVSNFSLVISILYYPVLGLLVALGWLPLWTIIFLTFIVIVLISRETQLWRG